MPDSRAVYSSGIKRYFEIEMGGDGERTFTSCKEYWQTSFYN
jgi:hypothetical protein